ncbi:uncharacterized protein LOC122504740 [Leptopilina heterotoma]|uniref:uncharacterized protein LOC122504740 n=1 Tax=Leptopilina heterotoma TaxID=63436 RepID=UPI001CA85C81|nr:uncharacterized protein LOC122504740 [Leptopilina heterotoma]
MKMYVRFLIFVSVMCFLYRGTESIKLIKDEGKIDTNLKISNSQEKGRRSTRSLINLQNEEALEHIKRIAEYFENDGPNRDVILKEPCKQAKCGECCNSRQSNKPPPSEPKDSIVGAAMGDNWCPAELLGITHHVKNSPSPKNEIVGSARQPLNSNNCPKQVITQPTVPQQRSYIEPNLNIETILPTTYYNPQPLPPLPAPREIAVPQPIILQAPQNQPVEQLQMPEERTLFGLHKPHFGIPLNNFIHPPIWFGLPPLFPKRPLISPTLPIGLFAPKLPFKLFHRKPHSCTSIAMPHSLSTNDLEASPSDLNPIVNLALPRQNVMTPEINYPEVNIETPVMAPRIIKKRLPLLNLGLKSLKFHLGSHLKDLYPTTYIYDAPIHPPLLNTFPIFTKNPHCDESKIEFDTFDELENANQSGFNETFR